MSATSERDEITIRRAESFEDYRACQEAQRQAWGIVEDGYVIPVATMVGAQTHGGLVLGAFLPSGAAIGVSFAFMGRVHGELCLYSQITGVVPGRQDQGIGYQLKQFQREWAQGEGLPLVAWAYDPFQIGNAGFNFNRLGVTSHRFLENMYGPRTDALNAGVPTDRLVVIWPTGPTEIEGRKSPADVTAPYLLESELRADGLPGIAAVRTDRSSRRLLLEVPPDIVGLTRSDRALADSWRAAVRSAFQTAFGSGYQAIGFIRRTDADRQRCFYLLVRE